LISWKYSFEEISKDLELAKKKKQALEDLFNAGKISKSTYESLNSDIGHTIAEIEIRQKALAEKMTSKLTDLEKQINTLEIFLANSEIQHVAGEIDDELHERESQAFGLGLDALRQQLDSIKGIIGDIMPEAIAPPPSETEEITEEKAETPLEAPSVEEAPVEVTEEIEATSEATAIEQPTETPEETEIVSEEMTAEQPIEAPTEEAPAEETPVQESTETPIEAPTEEIEEQAPSPEEVVEEPEATHELAVEEEADEAATEEEIETPTEEASYEQEEEVAAEEETEW
jgi:hypothetical protein